MDNLKCDVKHVNLKSVEYAKENQTDELAVVTTANMFKVLGNETRLKIVDLLSLSEMCVCDIAVVLDMTQSSISHQLSKLKKEGIVLARRDGSTIYYSLKDDARKEDALKAKEIRDKDEEDEKKKADDQAVLFRGLGQDLRAERVANEKNLNEKLSNFRSSELDFINNAGNYNTDWAKLPEDQLKLIFVSQIMIFV